MLSQVFAPSSSNSVCEQARAIVNSIRDGPSIPEEVLEYTAGGLPPDPRDFLSDLLPFKTDVDALRECEDLQLTVTYRHKTS